MINQRFSSFGWLNHKMISQLLLVSAINLVPNHLYKRPYQNAFFKLSRVSGFMNNQHYLFSSYKKWPKVSQKQLHKILKSQMKTDQKGQGYFLLYDAQKQQRSFQTISGLLLFFLGLTLVKIYYTQSEDHKDDYIILVMIAGSFILYQKRIFNTLKKVTLNSKGDKMLITTFNLLGKSQKTLEAPVLLMTGFSRATKIGGHFMTGGGKGSDFKEIKFWLSKQYITDRPTFQYVAHGRQPKIIDQFSTF